LCFKPSFGFKLTLTRSSAVAERPCDASCHWILR